MRILVAVMLALIVLVQYRTWVGEDSLADVWRLEQAVDKQRAENARLRLRNERMAAEVHDLKQGLDAVEARARRELGMIHRDEVLYQFVGR